ncbi:MAG TPA: cysteine desulfurase NifS, partial [Candidatus Paceibacterota bacterium]|nr:cysteine desulfurase NifS [Candidatus Paceibacterota bacterium]
HVMQALGQDTTLIHGTLRFTLGRSTTKDDIDYVMKVLPRVIERLRSVSALTTSYVATHSR